MKPAQWTAVLVLALMVGGISFVSVYLGGSSSPEQPLPTETSPALTFPVKLFPQEGEKIQTTEIRQRGHQDFWFANESGQDVSVGLNAKGCTCSEVELTLAPASWRPYLLRSAATSALEQPLRSLASLTTLAAVWDPERVYPEMPDSEETSKVLTLENYAVVPAGAVGRVRLSWRQESAKRLNTYADLWMDRRGGAVNAKLEVNVLISAPMEVAKDLKIPSIYERDLDKMTEGQHAEVVCFSMTRPSFDIKVAMLHEYRQPDSDPIEVGEPIPLRREELPRMENKETSNTLKALSGYRIPLTVRAKAKDGTPIEWGHFRRTVQVSSSDAGLDPVQIRVTGEVRGDITVGEGKGAGVLNLGPFPRHRGAHGSVLLRSDEKGVELELDAARKPEYLNASLDKPKEVGAGQRIWVLRVEVPSGAAWGEFPRGDNPVYRDSAIYVKTKAGKTPTSHRSIRIPVLGVANDD